MKIEYEDLENVIKIVNKHDKKFRIRCTEYPLGQSMTMWNYAVVIYYEDRTVIADRRIFDLMGDEDKQRKKDLVHGYIYNQLMFRGLYACLEEVKKHPPGPIFLYIR